MNTETRKRPEIKAINIVMDCSDAGIMAEFYSKLLGWEYNYARANGWAAITSPTGQVIAFQELEDYEPPVWPWQKGKQAQMLHLDLVVDNMDEGVNYALECGARLADEQYYDDSRTMLDPAGHPFCIDTLPEQGS